MAEYRLLTRRKGKSYETESIHNGTINPRVDQLEVIISGGDLK